MFPVNKTAIQRKREK